MSQIYRSIAASTKTVSQALAIAGVVTLAIVIYTGFVIPRPLMHPWFKWISVRAPKLSSFFSTVEVLLTLDVLVDQPCSLRFRSYFRKRTPWSAIHLFTARPSRPWVYANW